MNKTNRQNNCLEKALRFKNSDSVSEALGKIYLQFCDDGFISFNSFLQQAHKKTATDTTTKVTPTIPFKDFLQRYERELTPKERL